MNLRLVFPRMAKPIHGCRNRRLVSSSLSVARLCYPWETKSLKPKAKFDNHTCLRGAYTTHRARVVIGVTRSRPLVKQTEPSQFDSIASRLQ